MKKGAAVVTLALAVTLAALAYAQDNGAPPDVSPPANNTGSGPSMPNVTLPSGWANPNTGGEGGSVNNGVNAEPPAVVPAVPVDSGAAVNQSSGDDNSNATSGNDASGAGWGTSDSNATDSGDNEGSDSSATNSSDNGGSDSSATGGGDTGDSDSGANGADNTAGAGEMSNGSGDSDSNAGSDSAGDDSGNSDSGGADSGAASGD